MKSLSRLMDNVLAYRLWQKPFAEKKLEPLRRHNDLASVRRVLDVGCGPGTNTRHFTHADYVGLDSNSGYMAYARRRFGERFVLADVRQDALPEAQRFDFILANSFLHHIDLPDTRRILSRLETLLTETGHVHILDLVMPDRRGIPRLLAQWDRGDHARSLEEWRAIFAETFEPVVFEPYPVGLFGVILWNMVYFKGKRRV